MEKEVVEAPCIPTSNHPRLLDLVWRMTLGLETEIFFDQELEDRRVTLETVLMIGILTQEIFSLLQED